MGASAICPVRSRASERSSVSALDSGRRTHRAAPNSESSFASSAATAEEKGFGAFGRGDSRMTLRRKRVRQVGVLVGLLLFTSTLTSCGNSSSSSPPSGPKTSPATTPAAPPAAPSTAAATTSTTQASTNSAVLGEPVNKQTIALASTDGYTGKVFVEIYPPARASSPPPLPASGRSTVSCPVNGSGDALIPIVVRVLNTTSGFTTAMHLTPTAFQHHAQLAIDIGSCWNGVNGQLTISWAPTAFNSSRTAEWYLVVPRYYTPNNPDGDPAALSDACLGFMVAYGGFGVDAINLNPTPYQALSLASQGLSNC